MEIGRADSGGSCLDAVDGHCQASLSLFFIFSGSRFDIFFPKVCQDSTDVGMTRIERSTSEGFSQLPDSVMGHAAILFADLIKLNGTKFPRKYFYVTCWFLYRLGTLFVPS